MMRRSRQARDRGRVTAQRSARPASQRRMSRSPVALAPAGADESMPLLLDGHVGNFVTGTIGADGARRHEADRSLRVRQR
jgi:hypothetical protein